MPLNFVLGAIQSQNFYTHLYLAPPCGCYTQVGINFFAIFDQ